MLLKPDPVLKIHVIPSALRVGLLAIFCLIPPAICQDLTLQNPDFESGTPPSLPHWRWWSRNHEGSSIRTDAQAPQGKYSVRIEHEGPRDWAFSNATTFPVTPGSYFRISAQVKVEKGVVTLAAVGLQENDVLTWDIGSTRTGPTPAWKKISALIEVPEHCNRIYLRFVGQGKTMAWVDELHIESAAAPPPKKPKPKIAELSPTRIQENMDRAMIARPREDGSVYLGWRLLPYDPGDISFTVYRQNADETWTKLTPIPLSQSSNFVDSSAPKSPNLHYQVRKVIGGIEQSTPIASAQSSHTENKAYISLPLQRAEGFQKVGIADLDGDGRYDFVIKTPAQNIDPYAKYWKPSPDSYSLEAYSAEGTFLWRHPLGWSIERGIWYSPYVVFDFNGDGLAEVAVKTGTGDPRDASGRVTQGEEFLTLLDGRTGHIITQTAWPSRTLFDQTSSPYNYASRNQLGVAYLDGKTPCLLVARGTYNVMVLEAYTLQGSSLKKCWEWSNIDLPSRFQGQGAHGMHVADLDGDGRDEVVLGSVVIDDNGDALWSTGRGHPDHVYLGELDPAHPGLEIYYGLETHQKNGYGMGMVDAATGTDLWGFPGPTRHIHSQGMGSDIDPRYDGVEFYSVDTDAEKKPDRGFLWSSSGELIQSGIPWRFGPHTVYWDANLQRELLWKSQIQRFDGVKLRPKIQGNVVAVADIYGDWREEIITSVNGEIRIYTTTLPAEDRRVCLMSDPIYRIDVAHASMGYFQIPMLSYDLTRAPTPANQPLP
ncbi:carbohydrate binding domain-containing protein [Kiritimatiellota bacterium B12222]|nr:carbohydrate binding domain-containing protein [Kiritimatiellota bacterium B12222]